MKFSFEDETDSFLLINLDDLLISGKMIPFIFQGKLLVSGGIFVRVTLPSPFQMIKLTNLLLLGLLAVATSNSGKLTSEKEDVLFSIRTLE